ncbi:hypothetical protein LOK49_LG10G01412 [Camellia lanceoleosa]|uniref:Uncharacterized protein n=1 Tax=Camellia lanceoleosa TaxID=1840588 RepID=A0ACC0GCP3_9ERIC|nr:hypothetical protein LOK49_LG10G01412 [Camellia lanceoleosa]
MSHQFGWSSFVARLVQSSFFWGYTLSQLPGGWLAKTFGGRKVLEIGVLIWSLATALVPVLAGFMPGLVLSRILASFGSSPNPKFWLGICILPIWPFGDSLELLRRGHAKSSGGVNLLYIVLVGLIGILMGYFMRKS